MKVLFLLLALVGFTYSQVEPYGTNICRLFKDGAKLRKPGSCDSNITCKDGKEVITKCSKGKFYNKDSGKCVSKAPDAYCKDPCNKKSPFWEADPKSCEGYFKCVNSKGTQEYCPDDLHFDFKKQSCVFQSESSCKGYDYCDIVPNKDVPFKNENNCQKYYTCVKNKLTENICTKGYYDAKKGCMKKSEVQCLIHPIPVGICGTPKKPVRDKFTTDERTCSGYFFCRDKGDNVPDTEPTLGKCPEGKFFDYTIQGCYTASSVKCEEDRCDGMNRSKVISGTKGCQHYLVCEKNSTVREEKCPDGMYFDDSAMDCTASVMEYQACS